MKVLYAIQGTGNGHLSRAREIIPHLIKHASLDLLISGSHSELGCDYLVKYRKNGMGFTFGKNGGINKIDTVKKLKPLQFMKDVLSFPVHDYDLIINDFEPVTAWACKFRGKDCLAMSHQSAFLSEKTPRPLKISHSAELLLKHYAPSTSHVGFHFLKYDQEIYTPIIFSKIRKLDINNFGHYTVYLPAHSDDTLIKYFTQIPDVRFDVFSKHSKQSYQLKNVHVQPIQTEAYMNSLSGCEGLITGGGFESPAEAMYLQKKVLVVPMSDQYEQQCNAAALKSMGLTVVKKINDDFLTQLKGWINYGFPIKVYYPDITAELVENVLASFQPQKTSELINEVQPPNLLSALNTINRSFSTE